MGILKMSAGKAIAIIPFLLEIFKIENILVCLTVNSCGIGRVCYPLELATASLASLCITEAKLGKLEFTFQAWPMKGKFR